MMIRSVLRYAYHRVCRWIAHVAYGAHADHLDPTYVVRLAIFQRIIGINRRVPWVVHFSSRVIGWERVSIRGRTNPGYSPGCYIQAVNGIELGVGVLIGPNVCLISANHRIGHLDEFDESPPIRIGNDAWIGANSVVLPGVRVGDRAVIGAGSVVVRDVPADCVAAENPCQVVRCGNRVVTEKATRVESSTSGHGAGAPLS